MPIRRAPKAHTPQRPVRASETGAPPARVEGPKEAETETLARVSDAFSRARPPAEPPATPPAGSRAAAPGSVSTRTLQLGELDLTSEVRPPLSPEARLRALVGVLDPQQSRLAEPPPDNKRLGALVRGQVGPRSVELSATEIAGLLGKPSWASAIAELGDRVCKPGARAPHFLLAAHLARWMDGIFPGATQEDVVDSFKAAQPEVAARFENLDAEMLELLQRTYRFMPGWRQKPKNAEVAGGLDDWLDVPDTDELYAERLDHALSELSEMPLVMKLTQKVGQRLADDQRFAGHNVVMVQHMLGQASPFLDAMCAAGLEVDKAEYVGVPYQQNPAVKLTLEKTYGLDVRVPARGDMDAMWQAVCDAVDRAVERHEKNGEPILVLDDGGYASKYIAQRYPDKAHLFKVVEQTTRGLTEIKKTLAAGHKIEFPIQDVAGSYGKRFESAQVGDAVVQAIRRVLDEVAKTPARKDVLVVGAGKVGVGVATAFKGDGSRVSIFDPYLSPARVKQLRSQGFRVITDKHEALAEKFLVVGCSGHRSINMDDFVKMSSPVFLASSSSKRVEIDTLGLKELATDKDGVLRRVLAARVNEQETWHYWTQDGRIVTTLADGLPVNFQDVNSIAPELIDHTMALMLLGAGAAVNAEGEGLIPLDPLAQFELQAEMEGLSTTRGHPSERSFQIGEAEYFGSQYEWEAIASSSATPPAVAEAIVAELTTIDGDSLHYAFDMDPVLLRALESPKEVTDATVDRILEYGFLPHIAHLARNPELSEGQTKRVIHWLQDGLAWIDSAPQGERAPRRGAPVGLLPNSVGTPTTAMVGTHAPLGRQRKSASILGLRGSEVRAQLTSILYTHPACPDAVLDGFYRDLTTIPEGPDEPPKAAWRERMEQVDPANVFLLRNPRWTPEQLDQLANALHAPMMAMVPKERLSPHILENDPFLASQLGTMEVRPDESLEEASQRYNRAALYAYDVFDAIATHPNSSPQASHTASMHRTFIADVWSDQMVLRGVDSWRVDATGAPAPDYV